MARREPRIGSIKGTKIFCTKDLPFGVGENVREKEREREAKVFFGDSRGLVARKSLSLELKFFVSTRAMHRHQKRRDFT